MAIVGDLLLVLRAETATFAKDLGKAQELSARNAREMKRSFDIISVAAGTVLAHALMSMGRKFADATETVIKLGHEMEIASTKTGLSVESLSALKYVARQSDVEFEGLVLSLNKFNKAIDAARGGGKEYAPFKRLGISPDELKGADAAERLLFKVADAIKKTDDAAGAAAISVAFFGKSGYQMLPFLKLGADGIRQLMEEARRFGIVISTENAVQAGVFVDNLKKLQDAKMALGNTIMAKLLPALNALTDSLTDSQKQGNLWVGVGEDVADVLKFMAAAAIRTVFGLMEVARAFKFTGALAAEYYKNLHWYLGPAAGGYALAKSANPMTAIFDAGPGKYRGIRAGQHIAFCPLSPGRFTEGHGNRQGAGWRRH